MSEYEMVNRTKLNLKKDDSELGIKKKKKKSKKRNLEEAPPQNSSSSSKSDEPSEKQARPGTVYKTKAEMAFINQREKKQKERILHMASRSHKQRVEDFNRHLDNLTEHFDIPKVSWTK